MPETKVFMQNKKWWTGVIVGFSAAIGMVTWGCQAQKTKIENPASSIGELRTDVAGTAEVLKGTTTEIKQSATDGQKKTPPAVRNTLDPYWISILTNAGKQENLVTQLQSKDAEIASIQKKTNDMSEWGTAQFNRAEKAEASLTDGLRRNLHYLVMVGVIGIAVSGVLVFTGNKMGVALGVGCAILTGVSLFIGQTAQLIPWIVGGIVIICSGFLIWHLIQRKKTEAVLNKAVVQLVKQDQGVQQLVHQQSVKKNYNSDVQALVSHVALDNETKALVEKVKSKVGQAPTVDLNGDGILDERDIFAEDVKSMSVVKKVKKQPVKEEIWTCRSAS